MDSTCILSLDEIAAVLKDLYRRRRYRRTRQSRVVFRLSCCCGLRRKEIAGLNLGDMILGGPKPCIRIRQGITKGRLGARKGRKVPLWHDSATLADITAWKAFRVAMGAKPDDPLVCSLNIGAQGKRLIPAVVSRAWHTAIRVLGKDRVRQLSIHKGRHTCASQLLAAGYSSATVRDWLGHRNISITNIYIHATGEESIRDVFGQMEKVK